MLIMKNINKIFQTADIQTHALRDFCLQVNEGDFVSVTGPSGSGKTTFLNIAGLLETYSNGEFLLDGEDVGKLNDNGRSRMRNQKIGFIFQGFNLIPDLNLYDNVDVPLRYRGFNAAERKRRIEENLERVLLADEPTGNLDSEMAKGVLTLLEEINQQGTTIIMVTHDAQLAQRAKRTIQVKDGRVSELDIITNIQQATA